MNASEIHAGLIAANPLPESQAHKLALHGAEIELIDEIVAIPLAQHPRTQRSPAAWRRRGVALALAAGVAVAIVVALLPLGGSGNGPAPAFAAALVRFANASPLALLKLPHWHVVYADEEPGGSGELDFVRGPAATNGTPQGASARNEASLSGRVASLTWQPLTPIERRHIASGHQDAQTALGVSARQFVLEGRSHGWLDISAFIIDQGRVLRFRATVPDMALFRDELRALTAVSTSSWLHAMPPGVIKSADSSQTVRLMLKGIPLPPGFDAARIRGARLVHNRYQLGAAVTGTIACMWIADWSRARASGNAAIVKRATAAMATAPHWPILRQMAHQGGWSQILIGYAKAMPSGTWYGRPLTGDVNDGLGCNEWGVHLNTPMRSSGFLPAPSSN